MKVLSRVRVEVVLRGVLAGALLGSTVALGQGEGLGHVRAEAPVYAPSTTISDPAELLPIQVNGGWGYVDRRGVVVVPPNRGWTDYFYTAGQESSGRRGGQQYWWARVVKGERTKWFWTRRTKGKLNATSMKGEAGLERNFDRMIDRRYVMRVQENGRERFGLGVFGEQRGDVTLYDGLLRPQDNMIAFRTSGKCGFLDRNGKVAIEPRFALVRSFHDGLAAVRLTEEEGGGWGYIDKRGQLRFHDQRGELEEARSFAGGQAAVKAGGKWGFVGKSFRVAVKPRYEEVRDFYGGCAAVKRDGAWGYVDRSGKEFAWGFEEAFDFEDPARMTGADAGLSEGKLALAKQGGLYGYIDRRGKWQIEPRFVSALPFFRGAARVAAGPDSFGYIDPRGKVLWDPRQAQLHGIAGWELPPPRAAFWIGLPTAGAQVAEPYAMEYEVEDRLPRQQPFVNELGVGH